MLTCKIMTAVATGDALCLTGYDDDAGMPQVSKATPAVLANSRTILGVARGDVSVPPPAVQEIWVAGDVAPQGATKLANGGLSQVVTVDANARLAVVARPNGSEFVVGTCDQNGHTAIQPRASRDTSAQHAFNVYSYGAKGDGSPGDEAAIQSAMNAIPASGGRLFFPPGTYATTIGTTLSIPEYIQVDFDEGAVLAPNQSSVTILGRITTHRLQRIFGGTGGSTPVSHDTGAGPSTAVSGNPFGLYSFQLRITLTGTIGGPPPAPNFQYSLDGATWSSDRTAAASVYIDGAGITITFNPGTYNAGPVPAQVPPDPAQDTYSWTSFPAIVVGRESFDIFHGEHWGAIADYDFSTNTWSTDNADPFQLTLGAVRQSGNRHAKLAAKGHFFLSHGIVVQESVSFEGFGREEPTSGGNRLSPGTALVVPRDVTGIRIASGYEPLGTGDETVIRNLTVYCNYIRPPNPLFEKLTPPDAGQTGNGIWINGPARVENVTVSPVVLFRKCDGPSLRGWSSRPVPAAW